MYAFLLHNGKKLYLKGPETFYVLLYVVSAIEQ